MLKRIIKVITVVAAIFTALDSLFDLIREVYSLTCLAPASPQKWL